MQNAAVNNSCLAMPMKMGDSISNMEWPMAINFNVTDGMSGFGNQASTGRIYSVDGEGGYQGKAFGNYIMSHPRAGLDLSSSTVSSGNLYTTDLQENSFYGELPRGGQRFKYGLMPISAASYQSPATKDGENRMNEGCRS